VPHEGLHSTSSQASNSPITDGERIYASFGSRGLHCLDMEGKLLWSNDYGLMQTRAAWGEGSSPALYEDTLVLLWDHEKESFIAALDKKTGKEHWRRERDEPTNWTTPIVVDVDGSPQVIVPATNASCAYDLKTGETIWTMTGMTLNLVPTTLYQDGVAYLMSGFRGAALQAIELKGAKGELDAESDNVLWIHGSSTSYVPSGTIYDGLIYFLRVNSGVISCLDAMSGDVLYQGERLENVRTVYSSLVTANGHVYVTSREGTTNVIEHGPEFNIVAVNTLDDGFDASIVFAGDELYLRGTNHLYCIAKTD
jgi:outer membrane protein assembly factor BamB